MALKTPRNIGHTSLLLTFNWPKYTAWSYLTLKGVKKGHPAICLKKVNRKYVLSHKTITGPGLNLSRIWRMASHDYRI